MLVTMTGYKSKLHETVSRFPTDLWNDSCAVDELTYAMEHGATGATTNPVIVGEVLKKEWNAWKDWIDKLLKDNPQLSEIELTWKLVEEMASRGAKLLLPVFQREHGKKGRLSIQTNPKFYRNARMMADQAEYFSKLAPNMQVKIPVSTAGVDAIEEATARGVNVNATVCFSVPQAIAVAEAVERGLARREASGGDTSSMSPVCTIMVGRQDDWLKVCMKKDGVVTDPGHLEWAGVAVMKKAYGIYQQRKYRTRLLAAAYRNHFHWSEFTGGNVVLTIPHAWQVMFNKSDVPVEPRMDVPVPARIVEELLAKFPEFRKAYDEHGMKPAEFDAYGANRRTLRGFIKGYEDLLAVVRDRMLPDPDK